MPAAPMTQSAGEPFRQPDNGQPPARPQQPCHLRQRGAEVHVVQCRVGASEVEARLGKRIAQEIALDKAAVAGLPA